MKIYINDELNNVDENLSLSSYLDQIGMNELSGWAIAVNQEVVPSEQIPDLQLSEDDRILLIQATQGG